MAKDKPSTGASGETSIIVALMEQIEGMRKDMRSQSDAVNKKIDAQTETINRKLDQQSADTRAEFKELRDDMADMKARLAEGSERMKNLRRDVDDTKNRCQAVHAPSATTALERKSISDDETKVTKKKDKLPWWLILVAGGALSWVGERAISRFFNAMSDQPAVQTAPQQPALPAQPYYVPVPAVPAKS